MRLNGVNFARANKKLSAQAEYDALFYDDGGGGGDWDGFHQLLTTVMTMKFVVLSTYMCVYVVTFY